MVKKKIAKTNGIKNRKECRDMSCNSGGCVYGLGFIGSAVYYISIAGGFWMGVLGFLKSLVWPVFLVYELLKFVGA